MAKARAIVKRRKAVQNIKKITRTMQLISTAKYQKCFKRATAGKPYVKKITEVVRQLSSQVAEIKHPLLEANTATGKTAMLVLTSNRGLCGGFNAGILRTVLEHLRAIPADVQVDLDVAGKKGINYFKYLRRPVRKTYTHFDDRVRFEQIEPLANEFIERYTRKEIDAVHVAYMRFESAARQRPTVMPLLPLKQDIASLAAPGTTQPNVGSPQRTHEVQYDFSPPPAELLADLLPATVRILLFQCFKENTLSEQVARMVAMKAATDAAADTIKILTRTYNRARQSQITMELLDIMGGAEALK